jgi:hypothetical protein
MQNRLRTAATCLTVIVGEMRHPVILLQPGHQLPIAGRADAAASQPTRDLTYMANVPSGRFP